MKSNNTANKILLVDDDPLFIEIYTKSLQDSGYPFAIAATGAEALQKAKTEKPALILLDIMLPDINGLDVLKALKGNHKTARIPVWMITNLAEQLNRQTAVSLGAADYLVKAQNPPKQVLDKIKNFFGS